MTNKTILKSNIHFVEEHITIKKAIHKLGYLKNRFCIVVDKKKRFKGTITDGDIRRGLLKGYNSKDKIYQYSKKKNFVTYKKFNQEKINNILQKKELDFLPYINKKKEIIDIYTIKKIKDSSIKNSMLIMAGGKGFRLRPLTEKTPKPLLLVNNKPLIENIIINAKNKGLRNFIISINYLGKKIKKYLGNGKRYNVKIEYIEEKKPLGTAGALGLIKKFDSPIILSNSDIISNINYNEMIKYHKKKKALITVSAKIIKNTINYGNIITSGSRIKNIIEKPSRETKINAGIYIVDSKIKKYIKKNEYLDMTTLINQLIKKKLKVEIFPLHESWTDYGLKKNILKHQS